MLMMPILFSTFRLTLRQADRSLWLTLLVMMAGIAGAAALWSLSWRESHYDRWIAGHERIFRIEFRSDNEPDGRIPFSPPGVRGLLIEAGNGPIEAVVRLSQPQPLMLMVDGKMQPVLARHADVELLSFFSLRTLAGDPARALSDPDSLVLTDETARRLFGGATAPEALIGRTLLSAQGGETLVLRAILTDLPQETHLRIGALLPANAPQSPLAPSGPAALRSYTVYSYLRAAERLPASLLSDHLLGLLQRTLPIETDDGARDAAHGTPILTPVADIHLESIGLGEMQQPGDANQVRSQMLLGFFLLVIVLANFGSHRHGRLLERAHEIGLRRVLGASAGDLFRHFAAEGALMAGVSLAGGLLLLGFLMPWLGSLSGADIKHPLLLAPLSGLLAALLFLLTGALTGTLPLLMLLRVRVHTLIFGWLPHGRSPLRSLLVVVQYVSAGFLIFSTIAIIRQMQHLDALPRGIALMDRYLVKLSSNADTARLNAFLSELERREEIVSVTAVGQSLPMEFDLSVPLRTISGRDFIKADPLAIDSRFARTTQLPLLAGRWFEAGRDGDSLSGRSGRNSRTGSIVLSQKAALLLGHTPASAAIGETVRLSLGGGPPAMLQVIGISDDAHWGPARDQARPTAYYHDPAQTVFSILLHAGIKDSAAVRAMIDQTWRSITGEAVEQGVSITPLRESFHELSADTGKRGSIFLLFAGLTMALAGLGIFNHALYRMDGARREIALRKVMGATSGDLQRLMLLRMMRPAIFATAIAAPAGFLYSSDWLSQFASRTDIGGPEAILTLGLLLLLSLAGSLTSVRRATAARPADVLRV